MTKNVAAPSTSPVWGAIGKIGVFISVLLGLFALYALLNPDKPRVKATCNVIEIPVRPDESPTPPVAPPPSEPLSKKSSDKEKPSDRKANDATTVSGAKQDTTIQGSDITFHTVNFVSFPPIVLSCDISNAGTQEAKDVVLDLPFEAKTAKLGDRVLPQTQLLDKSVSLGVIRPNAKVNLLVWGESFSYKIRTGENYSISYTGGVGTVLFPTLSYGVIGTIAQFLDLLARTPALQILLFAPICLVGLLCYRLLEAHILKGVVVRDNRTGTSDDSNGSI